MKGLRNKIKSTSKSKKSYFDSIECSSNNSNNSNISLFDNKVNSCIDDNYAKYNKKNTYNNYFNIGSKAGLEIFSNYNNNVFNSINSNNKDYNNTVYKEVANSECDIENKTYFTKYLNYNNNNNTNINLYNNTNDNINSTKELICSPTKLNKRCANEKNIKNKSSIKSIKKNTTNNSNNNEQEKVKKLPLYTNKSLDKVINSNNYKLDNKKKSYIIQKQSQEIHKLKIENEKIKSLLNINNYKEEIENLTKKLIEKDKEFNKQILKYKDKINETCKNNNELNKKLGNLVVINNDLKKNSENENKNLKIIIHNLKTYIIDLFKTLDLSNKNNDYENKSNYTLTFQNVDKLNMDELLISSKLEKYINELNEDSLKLYLIKS